MSEFNAPQKSQTATTLSAPAPSGILQRKCASCGNHIVSLLDSDNYCPKRIDCCIANIELLRRLVLAFLIFVFAHLSSQAAAVPVIPNASFQPKIIINKNVNLRVRRQPDPSVYQPRVNTVNLGVDRKILQTGEEVKFTLTPANRVVNSPFIFTINFGDGTQTEKLSTGEISHVFRMSGTFTVSVEPSQPLGSEIFEEMPKVGNSVTMQVSPFTLTANPTTTSTKQRVRFQVQPLSKDLHIRFRFVFGDDSASSDWKSEATATHQYSSEGNYPASVEIGRAMVNGVVERVDKSNTKLITIALNKNTNSTIISPTRPPIPTPPVPPPAFNFPWWLIFIGGAAILLALIFAVALLIAAFRIFKLIWSPRPTFQAHPDSGSSRLEAVTGIVVNLQLRLNVNTSAGLYQLINKEVKFVKSLRRENV